MPTAVVRKFSHENRLEIFFSNIFIQHQPSTSVALPTLRPVVATLKENFLIENQIKFRKR